jgi:hypothetical protein
VLTDDAADDGIQQTERIVLETDGIRWQGHGETGKNKETMVVGVSMCLS